MASCAAVRSFAFNASSTVPCIWRRTGRQLVGLTAKKPDFALNVGEHIAKLRVARGLGNDSVKSSVFLDMAHLVSFLQAFPRAVDALLQLRYWSRPRKNAVN